MRALSYITVILIFFNVLFAFRFFYQNNTPITLTQEAIKPSIHLVNSKLYFEENNYNRSVEELKNGILEIEALIKYLRPASKEKVIYALDNLRNVYQKARGNRLPKDQINEASTNMLLSLTYIQVKAAGYFVAEGEQESSRTALRYAMYHIKSALILSEGTKKEYEIQIYAEMNEIIKNRELSSSEIELRIAHVESQLENSKVTFS